MAGKSHLNGISAADVFATGGFTIDPNNTFPALAVPARRIFVLTDVIVFPLVEASNPDFIVRYRIEERAPGAPVGTGRNSSTTPSAPMRTGASTSRAESSSLLERRSKSSTRPSAPAGPDFSCSAISLNPESGLRRPDCPARRWRGRNDPDVGDGRRSLRLALPAAVFGDGPGEIAEAAHLKVSNHGQGIVRCVSEPHRPGA